MQIVVAQVSAVTTGRLRSSFLGVVRGVNLLRNAVVGLAGVMTVRQVLGYAEAYTRVQNNLRVAGVASSEMADATREVFDIATRPPRGTGGLQATIAPTWRRYG